jgi:hypothetical protein
MVKKWPRVTLVHAPTIAALWLLDAQFVNRYHIYIHTCTEGDVCDGYNSILSFIGGCVITPSIEF